MNQARATTTDLLLATCRADPASPDPHDHVPLPAGTYRLWRISAAHALPLSAMPDGDTLILIHGFHCTERDGLATAIKLRDGLAAFRLPLAGPGDAGRTGALQPLAFTWPCQHTLLAGYFADKAAAARFAAFALANLITDLRRAQPGRRLHVIAHSMGCFVALKALVMLAVLRGDDGPAVDSLIWLAPDVNADALERSASDARPLDGYGYAALRAARDWSIYWSWRDEALCWAPIMNRWTEERVGAAWGVRLGWCGLRHPERAVPRHGAVRWRLRLMDCTPIVGEHGAYFTHPVVQRDLAAWLAQQQAERRVPAASRLWPVPCVAPPPERVALPPPAAAGAWPEGVESWTLRPPNPADPDHTRPQPGAPADAPTPRWLRAALALWRSPLGAGIVAALRWLSQARG